MDNKLTPSTTAHAPRAIEAPVAEAPANVKSVSKADLSKMSKLELQVMAQNAGVILTGKEKKQQLVSKLVKHLAL